MALAQKQSIISKNSPPYVLAATPRSVVISEQSGIALTVSDIAYSVSRGSGTHEVFDVAVTKNPANLVNPTYISTTPNKCSVAASGQTSYVTTGACVIQASTALGNMNISYSISATGSAAHTFNSVSSYATSSLRKYLYDQQIAALVGVTTGTTAQARMVGGVYNPDLFIRATGKAGFTALSAVPLEWVVVHGRFYLTAHHYLAPAGHDMSPASAENGWSEPVAGNSRLYYQVATYSGAVCKVLPDNWQTKLPAVPFDATTNPLGFSIPVWARMFNTYGEATNYWVMPVNYGFGNPFPVGDSRRTYQRFQASPETMVTGGDSNSPVFCGINGDVIVLPHVAFAGLMGTGTAAYSNSMLTSSTLNPLLTATAVANGDNNSYSVTEIDLSGFVSYV